MSEIFYFFSEKDPCLVQKSLELGYVLIVNKKYGLEEPLITYTAADPVKYQRFYIVPNSSFVSEFVLGVAENITDGKFKYIKDRYEAASIALILYKTPSKGEICVGSLGFQSRTYRIHDESLKKVPQGFNEVYRNLFTHLKSKAEALKNKKFPKVVYVYPDAMSLLRNDPALSPWSSIEL